MPPITRLAVNLLVISVSISAIAAQTSTLSGRIINAALVGIPGVTLRNDAGIQSTITDAAGIFTITGLTNNRFTINIIPPLGTYAPSQRRFQVNGITSTGDISVLAGAAIQGTMLMPDNSPVINGNVNAYDIGGNKLYTPGDATNLLGQFAITVPLGEIRLRTVTPSALNLVPQEQTIQIAGPFATGTLHLQAGLRVSGTFIDQISGVPIGSVRVTTTNGITGASVLQLTPLSSALGAFSLLLPIGSYDLTVEPPSGNAHVPKIIHGVLTAGTTLLGPVPLARAAFVSGTLSSPTGPVAGADIDVYTADGLKLYSTTDSTAANGTFSLAVPLGSHRLTFQPPVATGLVSLRTAIIIVTANANLGNLVVTQGIPVDISVTGANGPEVDANLDLLDPFTGAPIVMTGDHSLADGTIHTIVPAGIWNLDLHARQGSLSAPFRLTGAPIFSALNFVLPMSLKTLRLDVQGFGVQTIFQGGAVPIALTVQNTTPATLATTIEIFVRFPSGIESPILPAIPIDIFPLFQFTLGGLFIPTPVVPITEQNRELRLVVRMRNAADAAVLDEAYAQFVVQ